MNYVGSISIIDRGDAPAKAVIDKNSRSLAQRVADETKEELDKVMDRVDNIYVSYEMSTQTMFENPRGSPNVEYIEDIKELEQILTDKVKKKKYQQQVTVFIVGFQDICSQKMQLLQQVNQFFLENAVLDEDELLEDSPSIDLEEAANQVNETLNTAEDLAKKLNDLNQDMIEYLVHYANNKASNKGKKRLEKSLEAAKNDMSSLSEKLLTLQTELEEKDEKFQQVAKQLDSKTQEALRYKTAAEVAKKSAQDNEAHTSTLQDEIIKRDEKIQEMRTKLSRLEINMTESQFEKDMSVRRLDNNQTQTKLFQMIPEEKEIHYLPPSDPHTFLMEEEEKLAKLQEEVVEKKMAVHDAEREMEKLHKEQITGLKVTHKDEITELKKEHVEELSKLTEELASAKKHLKDTEQQAQKAFDDSDELRRKLIEIKLNEPEVDLGRPISQSSSARISSGKSIAELSLGDDDNQTKESRQSVKETKPNKRADTKPSKTLSKSPNRLTGKEKSGRSPKDLVDASVQDEGGDSSNAYVEKSNNPSRQPTRQSKNLDPVTEDGQEFTTSFELDDDESWSSVPANHIPGRFSQYRQLSLTKIKELEDQLNVTLTKTHRKVNSLKQQFSEHKGKWEAERKVLIEQVEQAQKLQTDAEKEADAAMTQLEEFINEQEKLEDEEESKRQEIIKTMSRPGTVKRGTPILEKKEVTPEVEEKETEEEVPGERIHSENSEQELKKLMQQTDDAKSRMSSTESGEDSQLAPWLTPNYIQGNHKVKPDPDTPTDSIDDSRMTSVADVPMSSRLTSIADAEIQKLLNDDGAETRMSNIVEKEGSKLQLKEESLLPIDGLKGEREKIRSRASSKASRPTRMMTETQFDEKEEEELEKLASPEDEETLESSASGFAPWLNPVEQKKKMQSRQSSRISRVTTSDTIGKIDDTGEVDSEPEDENGVKVKAGSRQGSRINLATREASRTFENPERNLSDNDSNADKPELLRPESQMGQRSRSRDLRSQRSQRSRLTSRQHGDSRSTLKEEDGEEEEDDTRDKVKKKHKKHIKHDKDKQDKTKDNAEIVNKDNQSSKNDKKLIDKEDVNNDNEQDVKSKKEKKERKHKKAKVENVDLDIENDIPSRAKAPSPRVDRNKEDDLELQTYREELEMGTLDDKDSSGILNKHGSDPSEGSLTLDLDASLRKSKLSEIRYLSEIGNSPVDVDNLDTGRDTKMISQISMNIGKFTRMSEEILQVPVESDSELEDFVMESSESEEEGIETANQENEDHHSDVTVAMSTDEEKLLMMKEKERSRSQLIRSREKTTEAEFQRKFSQTSMSARPASNRQEVESTHKQTASVEVLMKTEQEAKELNRQSGAISAPPAVEPEENGAAKKPELKTPREDYESRPVTPKFRQKSANQSKKNLDHQKLSSPIEAFATPRPVNAPKLRPISRNESVGSSIYSESSYTTENDEAETDEGVQADLAPGQTDALQNLKTMMTEDNLTLEQQKTLDSLRSALNSMSAERANKDMQLERTITILSLASQLAHESIELGIRPNSVFNSFGSMDSRSMSALSGERSPETRSAEKRSRSKEEMAKKEKRSKVEEMSKVEDMAKQQILMDEVTARLLNSELKKKEPKFKLVPETKKQHRAKSSKTKTKDIKDAVRPLKEIKPEKPDFISEAKQFAVSGYKTHRSKDNTNKSAAKKPKENDELLLSGSMDNGDFSDNRDSFSASIPRTMTSSEWQKLSLHDPFSPEPLKPIKTLKKGPIKTEKKDVKQKQIDENLKAPENTETTFHYHLATEELYYKNQLGVQDGQPVNNLQDGIRDKTVEESLPETNFPDGEPSKTVQDGRLIKNNFQDGFKGRNIQDGYQNSNVSIQNGRREKLNVIGTGIQDGRQERMPTITVVISPTKKSRNVTMDDMLYGEGSLSVGPTGKETAMDIMNMKDESVSRNRSVKLPQYYQIRNNSEYETNTNTLNENNASSAYNSNCDNDNSENKIDHNITISEQPASFKEELNCPAKVTKFHCVSKVLTLELETEKKSRKANIRKVSKAVLTVPELTKIPEVEPQDSFNIEDLNVKGRKMSEDSEIVMELGNVGLKPKENDSSVIKSEPSWSETMKFLSQSCKEIEEAKKSEIEEVDLDKNSKIRSQSTPNIHKSVKKPSLSNHASTSQLLGMSKSKKATLSNKLSKSQLLSNQKYDTGISEFKLKNTLKTNSKTDIKRLSRHSSDLVTMATGYDIDDKQELRSYKLAALRQNSLILPQSTLSRTQTPKTPKSSLRTPLQTPIPFKAPDEDQITRAKTPFEVQQKSPIPQFPEQPQRKKSNVRLVISPRTVPTPGTAASDIQRPLSPSSGHHSVPRSPLTPLFDNQRPVSITSIQATIEGSTNCKETQTEPCWSNIDREPIKGATEDDIRASSAKSRASLRNQFKHRLDETRQAVEDRRTKSPVISIPSQKSIEDELIEDDDEELPYPDDMKDELLHEDTMEMGTSPPPGKRVSVLSRHSINLSDHLVVQEYLRAYTGIHNFKEAMTRVLVDKDQMSASQILADLDVLPFDKESKVEPQISNMTENIYYVLNEVSQVLNSVLQNDRGPVVSSLMMGMSRDQTQRTIVREKTGVTSDLPATRGSVRSASTKINSASTERQQYKELQEQYEKLQNHMSGESKKYEEQQRHNMVVMMEMQDTINQLQRELSALGKQTHRPTSATLSANGINNTDSAVMFTRLDSERNAKIMKKAVNDEKLDAKSYKEAMVQMDEYVSLPAQRLAHLVRKYVHHCRMKEIEENVQQSNSLNENVFDILDKMESLQNQRARRWADRMDEMGIERLRLANMLMETLDDIEQESGIFLIKPMYSYRGREPKERFGRKISRPFRPQRNLSPLRDINSAYAPAPTPASNMRAVIKPSQGRGDAGQFAQAQEQIQARYDPPRPLEGDSKGLHGSTVSYMGPSQPGTTWSMSDSQPKGEQYMQGSMNTPRILELDINRMMIGQNTISAHIGNTGISNDRLVNAANNNLRSYMTVNRPTGPSSAGKSDRPSSGSRQSQHSPSSPSNMGAASAKRVRMSADVEIPTILTGSTPLPPIGRPNSAGSTGSARLSPTRIPSGEMPPMSPPGSSLRQSPAVLNETESISPIK